MSVRHEPVAVTGVAGFIGFHLAVRLLKSGRPVIGVDNLNHYYDPRLKQARLEVLRKFDGFTFHVLDLAYANETRAFFADWNFGPVVHLAAQAGVRHSLEAPHAYLDANLAGFLNVLEGCRARQTPHLVFASSSSVYGSNRQMPFSTHQNVDHPLSLYGATKKANELMAHAYSHLFDIPATGLRFFTVYGPWGRPDMAMFLFAKAICEGEPIRLFNYGRMRRDFTYVDDVVEAMERLIDKPPKKAGEESAAVAQDPASSAASWRIYNIGNNDVVDISRVVALLERELGRKAKTELVPMQPGDVAETWADCDDLAREIGFRPSTPIDQGIARFIAWFREYHAI